LSTFIVPELVNADFTTTIEGMIIQYLYDKWTVLTPPKPTTFPSSETLSFRVGFFDFSRPYEINAIQTETIPTWWDNGRRRVQLQTTVEVHLRMQRLDRDAVKVDPELALMEYEIMRIALQYVKAPQDIPGIKDIIWAGQIRDYNLTDEWSMTDWRSIVRLNVSYEKVNVA
jgi:hypothetical protein